MWQVLQEAVGQWWNKDNPFQLSAALAYYTIFSMAPLFIIAIAIAGFFFGQEATENRMVGALQGVVGQESAQAIQAMIRSASQRGSGVLATLLGLGTLLLGATGAFAHLQQSLNTIWGVEPKPNRGVMGVLKDRLASFVMVLAIGLLLLVALAASAVVSALGASVGSFLPGGAFLWRGVDFLVSLGVITLLFAMIYKILPDVNFAWKDVWVGAAITSLLFTIGKVLIGLYLGYSSAASAYGAAGSLVVILLWVYYSSLILFLGAEVTEAYAKRYGSGIRPAPNAVRLTTANGGEPSHGNERETTDHDVRATNHHPEPRP